MIRTDGWSCEWSVPDPTCTELVLQQPEGIAVLNRLGRGSTILHPTSLEDSSHATECRPPGLFRSTLQLQEVMIAKAGRRSRWSRRRMRKEEKLVVMKWVYV